MTLPRAFEPPDSDIAAILDRHARQRANDHPVLSVLVGEANRCAWSWNRWVDAQGRAAVAVDVSHCGAIAAVLATTLMRQRNLVSDALHELSRRTDCSQDVRNAEWSVRTGAERSLWLDRIGGGNNSDIVDRLCRAVLSGSASESLGSDESGLSQVPRELDGWPPVELLAAMSRLIPAEELPAVAFWWLDVSFERLAKVADEFLDVAIAVPRIPIALLLPVAARPWLAASAGATRGMTFLREGLIVRGEGIDPESSLLAMETGDTPFGDRNDASTDSPGRDEIDDAARSAAERFLYDVLEATPATTGLFALNAKLDFAFGGHRAIEVDLACVRFKLAIEIDGYYHFLGAESYRRDRRKDLELQRRGWLVMRFLADDVGPRQEQIVAAIASAVEARRREIPR